MNSFEKNNLTIVTIRVSYSIFTLTVFKKSKRTTIFMLFIIAVLLTIQNTLRERVD